MLVRCGRQSRINIRSINNESTIKDRKINNAGLVLPGPKNQDPAYAS
jgi:hypothetical protein